jgi:hypothetical protein
MDSARRSSIGPYWDILDVAPGLSLRVRPVINLNRNAFHPADIHDRETVSGSNFP